MFAVHQPLQSGSGPAAAAAAMAPHSQSFANAIPSTSHFALNAPRGAGTAARPNGNLSAPSHLSPRVTNGAGPPRSSSPTHRSSHGLPTSPSFTKEDAFFQGRIGTMTEREQQKVVAWTQRDAAYEASLRQARAKGKEKMSNALYGLVREQDWLGLPPALVASNQIPGRRSRLHLVGLRDRQREEAKGKRNGRPPCRFTTKQLRTVAETDEILVPIRLEIDHDHWKLRDTFTWNLREPYITPELFATNLCKDLILPHEFFAAPIVASIKEQVNEHRVHEGFEGHVATATYSEEAEERNRTEETWWASWRSGHGLGHDTNDTHMDEPDGAATSQSRQDISPSHGSEPTKRTIREGLDADVPLPVEAFLPSQDLRDDELRISIKLDIVCGNVNLTDRFEWDVSDPANSPEQFADSYTQDLGLAGEFKTAVAHSIREQVDVYIRSLATVGHQPGFLVPHDELRFSFLAPVGDPFRGATDEYTPFINALTAEELDRQEKEHDRDVRRKRRQTRGRRAINLPDREPQRTARTTVPIQGRQSVVTYQDENDETVTPLQPVAQPYPILELTSASTPEKRNGTLGLAADGFAEPLTARREFRSQDGTGTPLKGATSRVSRRLRGVTVDDSNAATPLPEEFDSIAASPGASAIGGATFKKVKKGRPTKEELAAREAARIVALGGKPFDWEAAGLHDPMIDGVWHCSNCGCPEGIAIGRRKGAGGKDTLCGECGKYLHRYKKNRPTHYSSEASYHLNLKQEAERAKQALLDEEAARKLKKKEEIAAKKAASRVQIRVNEGLHGKVDSAASSPAAPLASVNDDYDQPSSSRRDRSSNRRKLATHNSRKRDRSTSLSSSFSPSKETSPHITISGAGGRGGTGASGGRAKRSRSASDSSSDLSGMPIVEETKPTTLNVPTIEVKIEGDHSSSSLSSSLKPVARDHEQESSTSLDPKLANPSKAPTTPSTTTSKTSLAKPLEWMLQSLNQMRVEYPNDRVDLIPKVKKEEATGGGGGGGSSLVTGSGEVSPVDWRLKCLDCPGKLYTVGPGETFQNFTVHLKNRLHRSKVDDRIRGSTA